MADSYGFINWDWQTPVDQWEDWDPARVDGRSDVMSMSLLSYAEPNDVEIVTLMMYMPSGDTPYLKFGYYDSGSSVLHDQTDQWTALPGFRANDIYIQSWWRRIVTTNRNVSVDLYNFDAPYGNTNPGSTEGGVVFMNVFQTGATPAIAYQQSSTSDMIEVPDSNPAMTLHQFFARRPDSFDQSIHGVVMRTPAYPTGYEGLPAGGGSSSRFIGWMSSVAEDNLAPVEGQQYLADQDLYATGFFYDFPQTFPPDTGPVTWDLSTPGGYDIPFGPAGSVQQGIKFLDTGGPIITFV